MSARDYHPAAKELPMLSDEELAEMADDIADVGLREPIELYEGKIIDGRNRLVACEKAGVEPEYVDIDLDVSPWAYVASRNLKRRHLTKSQRALAAAGLKKGLAKEAKQRQRLSKGRGQKGPEKLPDLNEPTGDARDQAGKLMGVSGKSVDHAEKVISSGSAEVVKAVRNGELPISTAAKLADLPKSEQNEALKGGKDAIKEATTTTPKEPSYPASDIVCDALEKVVATLTYIVDEHGTLKKMLKADIWDKGRTLYAKQLIESLASTFHDLSKEIK